MHAYLYKSWQTVQLMLEKFFVLLPQLILGGIVFLVFVGLALVMRWGVERLSGRYQYARNLALVLGRLAQAVVLAFGLLVAATVVAPSFHTADLIKVLGVGGIAIGFAFRDILQNFLAGIILLLHQPFRLGDQIRIDEFEGTVEAIETRATVIKTYDSRRVVIPNSEVFTKALIVNTAYESRRAEQVVGIGYGDDIETAKRVIVKALSRIEGVLDNPAPQVLVVELADFNVQLLVRYWLASTEQEKLLEVRDRAMMAIKESLNQAGIDMPYPTSQVLFHDQTEESDGDRSRQREGWPVRRGDSPQPRSIAAVIHHSLTNQSKEPGEKRDAA
ncbi:MAG: mechanosensitive ion channel family protein [Acidobacteria bacterium]|nr:mechanosensitive ion channel family protein [Acidobacteriota bacterium]